MNSRYPYLRVQCDEDCLGLGFDPVPKQTLFNVLSRFDGKPITYDNALSMKNRELLSENQVKNVEDIIYKGDTKNLGISSKEVIQFISELGQKKSFIQADNHLDCLIWVKRLTHFKRLGRVVSSQATTTERSQIFFHNSIVGT